MFKALMRDSRMNSTGMHDWPGLTKDRLKFLFVQVALKPESVVRTEGDSSLPVPAHNRVLIRMTANIPEPMTQVKLQDTHQQSRLFVS